MVSGNKPPPDTGSDEELLTMAMAGLTKRKSYQLTLNDLEKTFLREAKTEFGPLSTFIRLHALRAAEAKLGVTFEDWKLNKLKKRKSK